MELLARRLDAFVLRPDVRVSLVRQSRVFVLGEVRAPGPFPLTRGLTIVEALTQAGYTASGEVLLIRTPGAIGPVLPDNAEPSNVVRVNLHELERRVEAGDLSGNVSLKPMRLLTDEGGAPDPAWLDALEEQMAARGVAIAAARLALVERLAEAAAATVGPFPTPALALVGTVEDWLTSGPALAAEDRLRAALAAARRADGDSGTTAVGPHRSDLKVADRRSGMPAAECSTGEQKALLIALVLAHARLQAAERGAPPVLLLDEVAAHLDSTRREALFAELLGLGGQSWLTGTDEALFAGIAERAQCFRVRDARILPAEAGR